MTDKRKAKAREISARTGMSHQAAINSLKEASPLTYKSLSPSEMTDEELWLQLLATEERLKRIYERKKVEAEKIKAENQNKYEEDLASLIRRASSYPVLSKKEPPLLNLIGVSSEEAEQLTNVTTPSIPKDFFTREARAKRLADSYKQQIEFKEKQLKTSRSSTRLNIEADLLELKLLYKRALSEGEVFAQTELDEEVLKETNLSNQFL